MEISTIKKNKTLIVKIQGEIDHHTCEILKNKVDNTLHNMNGKNIIIDMNQVTFMDSSGIGVIIGRYKLVKGIGGNICIISNSPVVNKMLEFSAISKIIKNVQSIEEGFDFLEEVN